MAHIPRVHSHPSLWLYSASPIVRIKADRHLYAIVAPITINPKLCLLAEADVAGKTVQTVSEEEADYARGLAMTPAELCASPTWELCGFPANAPLKDFHSSGYLAARCLLGFLSRYGESSNLSEINRCSLVMRLCTYIPDFHSSGIEFENRFSRSFSSHASAKLTDRCTISICLRFL